MRLRDLLRSRRMKEDDPAAPMQRYRVQFDGDGANFITTPEDFTELNAGRGQRSTQEQHLVLESLEEQGAAIRLPNGFMIRSADVLRLGEEEAELLGLPSRFPGRFRPEVTGNTTSDRFAVALRPELDGHLEPLSRTGPVIRIGVTDYLLTLRALRAIEAVEHHQSLPKSKRTEAANVRLVAELQSAGAPTRSPAESSDEQIRNIPLDLDLGHLQAFTTLQPGRVGLVIDENPDGSLAVTPDLGEGLDLDEMERRWHHLRPDQDEGVIRVGRQLVLLDEDRRKGVEDVLANPVIPAEQRDAFLRAPGDFFSPEYVDTAISFGVRVSGIGVIVPQTFADATDSGISWFGDSEGIRPTEILSGLIASLPQLDKIERDIETAHDQGRSVVTVDENIVDVSDKEAVESALTEARERLVEESTHAGADAPDNDLDRHEPTTKARAVQVGMHVKDMRDLSAELQSSAEAATPARPVDFTSIHFRPLPHQREGIEWLTAMMATSLRRHAEDPARIQGAILADDMGLGKTFMSLVALREFMELDRSERGEARPILAVLPLSLIENWQQEIEKVFPVSPFEDVVVLQSDRDLPRFKLRGAGRETSTSAANLDEHRMLRTDAIRFSLRVGETYREERLDQPGRLVLTTYQNLSSYQLSLAQVDWGCVIFDEAQTIKNPDTLATRAAKGLKAGFKLLATGTPIENKMLDFWCLMDTAQPGLLGKWADFRSRWVTPMENAEDEEKQRIGDDLRAAVGRFMLRRIKEDHLDDLPAKTVYAPEAGPAQVANPQLGGSMPPQQQELYDEVLKMYEKSGGTKGAALAAIQRLRQSSLHPLAYDTSMSAESADEGISLSARLIATTQVLDHIRSKAEKAIVFVINKRLQQLLALWLQERYGVRVRIVNGETAAVSKKPDSPTRRRIIEEFEAVDGFNVIVMSPLAVGVGLTVVGANHAIHLERHWNPAKEAQATDRIYRIGQTRPVHVYLPMALHPQTTSFDLNLDRLLRQKTVLRDAVVVPEAVSEEEMVTAMGIEE